MTLSPDQTANHGPCRLCGGPIQARFSATLLGAHSVQYFQCTQCGSLQTQPPFWLEEAYSGNLADIDTGAAQRNLNNLAAVYHMCRLFGLAKVLDYGAGDGLLCRLLRDYRINAFCTDKHARPSYAKGFEADEQYQPDVVVSFEVVEHFENPAAQLTALFGRQAKLVLITTELYTEQGPDWRYLMPESGQHVFFYTRKGLKDYAAQQGYRALFYGRYTLFVNKQYQAGLSWFGLRLAAMKLLFNRYGLQLFKIRMGFIQPSGVEADFQALLARNQQQAQAPQAQTPQPPAKRRA